MLSRPYIFLIGNIQLILVFFSFQLGDEVRGGLRRSSGLFFEGQSLGPDLERAQRKIGFPGNHFGFR